MDIKNTLDLVIDDCPERVSNRISHFDKIRSVLQNFLGQQI